MNLVRVKKIADAVLYEGYMLYPYRASAVKNQQRWNFGVLCPRAYSEEQNGSEAWSMQTECLLEADASTLLSIRVRFLQVLDRSIGKLKNPIAELSYGVEPEFELVDKLTTGGGTYTSWQEAVEREVPLPPLSPATFSSSQSMPFRFPHSREIEPLRNESSQITGIVIREWKALAGSVEIDVNDCGSGLFKIIVRICNFTSDEPRQQTRAGALMYSLVSTHAILAADGGQFVSLLDPPSEFATLAADCRNVGTWPVLAGDEGQRDMMLSSPIILYDYPQIAPESAGSLFDGTEIDEILSLRILTMTDEEKHEMRESDERAREILERTETMPPEQFMKLHGVLREVRPLRDFQKEEAP